MRKKVALFAVIGVCLASLLVLGYNSNSLLAGTKDDPNSNGQDVRRELSPEAQEALKRLRALIDTRDLKGIQALADEVEAKSNSWDKNDYGVVVHQIIGAFASYEFDDKSATILTRKYAKIALSKADEMSVEREFEIAMQLAGRKEYFVGLLGEKDWPIDRTERVKLWLHAWQRFESEIDRNFDINKRPETPRPPVTGQIWVAGMDPEKIKDPKIREEYKKSLEEFRRKIAVFNKQAGLKSLDQAYSKYLASFVIDAYSTQPYNWDELTQFMAGSSLSDAAKNNILHQVSQRMAAK